MPTICNLSMYGRPTKQIALSALCEWRWHHDDLVDKYRFMSAEEEKIAVANRKWIS